jgi:hypothetical protein
MIYSHKVAKSSLFLLGLIVIFNLSSCLKQTEEMENRDAILGQWDVVENDASTNPASIDLRSVDEAYIVNITRSDKFVDEVYIYNFYNVNSLFKVPAYVEDKLITIPKITLENHTIHGSGTIASDNKTIDWSYWVDDGYGDIEYVATYTLRE